MNAMPMQPETLTVDEYLAFEERQEIRHEFVGGRLYAMVGGTHRHNRIVSNLHIALGNAAANGPRVVHSQGMRVQVSQDTFYYPDIVMTCDPPEDSALYLDQPGLIVEVLSESTAGTDLREKLLQYLRFESLQTYLIVAQDTIEAYHHWRDEDGVWQTDYLYGNFEVPIPQLDMQLTIHDIYAGVIDIRIS